LDIEFDQLHYEREKSIESNSTTPRIFAVPDWR